MVAPVIAAVAPAAIDSARSEDGLINKLFKIAMLVGFLLLAVFAFFILNFVISISEVVGAGFDVVSAVFKVLLPAPIAFVFTAGASIFSAFGFGGRK